jgi:hypothetical protein
MMSASGYSQHHNISKAFSLSLLFRLVDTVMLDVSMTLASLRTIIAVDAVVPTIAPTWIRTLMSHHMLPSHHSSRLSRGQMSGLIELKKLIIMTHRMSDPADIFPCLTCQNRGGIHNIHDGKASIGRMIACGKRGAIIFDMSMRTYAVRVMAEKAFVLMLGPVMDRKEVLQGWRVVTTEADFNSSQPLRCSAGEPVSNLRI